jgi:hypothetical protein
MLLDEWLKLVARWEQVFSQQRVWHRARRLALGLMLGLGVRTITRALGALGREQMPWSSDYRVFSRSPWQPRELFGALLQEALALQPGAGPVVVAGDYTHLLRAGRKVKAAHWMRDPLSPAFHVNLVRGVRFFQLAVIVPNATAAPRAVPVAFAESPVPRKPGRKADEAAWQAYRAERKAQPASVAAREELMALRDSLDEHGGKGRELLIALDGSFCQRRFLQEPIEAVQLLCRARKDAVLCRAHQGPGRRFYARETFTPEAMRCDDTVPWQKMIGRFGAQEHPVRYKDCGAVYWRNGARRRPLRLIVLSPQPYRRSPRGRLLYHEPAYILTTDLTTPAEVLIQAYLDRWQIEVAHRDEKSVIGVGQAQVWNDRSVTRQPAFAVAAYALLLLAGLKAYGGQRSSELPALPRWRGQAGRPSCLDLVNTLRGQFAARPEVLSDWNGSFSLVHAVEQAAA